jgi:hypothetical protein
MDKQEATKLISEKITAAYALISEAEAISEQSGVGFNFDLTYGMGGHYLPQSQAAEWFSSDCYGEERGGWQASSQSC